MSKIIWDSVKVNTEYCLGFSNGYKNGKIIYQIFNKESDNNTLTFYMYHYNFENEKFHSYEMIKSFVICKSDDTIRDTLLILEKLEELQKFVNFFERRKKISKLVA